MSVDSWGCCGTSGLSFAGDSEEISWRTPCPLHDTLTQIQTSRETKLDPTAWLSCFWLQGVKPWGGIIKSQANQDGKRPPRPSSPASDLSPPCPLNNNSECHVHVFFESFQSWWLPHFPGKHHPLEGPWVCRAGVIVCMEMSWGVGYSLALWPLVGRSVPFHGGHFPRAGWFRFPSPLQYSK